MSVVTIKPITQAGIPQPIHRFSGTDSSVVMANRPSTFGGSGLPVADDDDEVEVTRQDKLVHWWKGEDLTSTIGGADWVAQNGATTSSGAGVNGEDVLLTDGTDDYFTTAYADVGVGTEFTVSFWVKSLESSTPVYTGSYQNFLGWGKTRANYGFYCGPHYSLQYFYALGNLDNGGYPNDVYARELSFNATHGINPQNWTMWTVTWSSGNAVLIYANGALIHTDTAVSGTMADGYDTAAEESNFELGRMYHTDAYYGNNLFQQIRVYDVELSASEISDMYGSGNGDWL